MLVKPIQKVSVLPTLRAMTEGESVEFDISRLPTVKSSVSMVNASLGFKSLTAKSDKKNGIVKVTKCVRPNSLEL